MQWRFLVCVLMLFLVACGGGEPELSEADIAATAEAAIPVETLYVAPYTEVCGDSECLLVRESLTDEWTVRTEDIAGFTYEAGYTYKITVAEDTLREVLSREGSFERAQGDGSGGSNVQTWYLDFMLTNQIALDTDITLEFGETLIVGYGGCNEYRASYSAGDNATLVIDTIDASKQICSELVTQQERDFFDALAMISNYEQADTGTLIFKDLQGQPVLTFVTSR